MVATAWLFALEHFSHANYLAWPLVVGVALLVAYSALSGLVFTPVADRVYGIARLAALASASDSEGFSSEV